jgi:membrane-associated protein
VNPILEYMVQYVEVYKYLAVFIFTFLGAVALPIPTGSMMIVGGLLAQMGHFSLVPLMVVGLLGNVVGDSTGYFLAKHSGMRLMKYPGFRRLKSKLGPMEQHMQKHPMLTVFWSRFFTAVAPTVNIVAGLAHMKYRKFLFYEFFGEVAEILFFTLLGYWFGKEWETVSKYSFLFLLGLMASLYLSARFWKSFTSKDGNESATSTQQ